MTTKDSIFGTYETKVRRTDRQKKDVTFLRKILTESMSSTIAVERKGHPLLHVAFFVYDENRNAIIFHFSKHGYAGKEIVDGKKVSVCVHKVGNLYTADRAMDFGCEYQSIIIYGKVDILKNPTAKMAAMQLFFGKFFSKVEESSYESMTENHTKEIEVAVVRIQDWVGKEHTAPEMAKAILTFPYPEKM